MTGLPSLKHRTPPRLRRRWRCRCLERGPCPSEQALSCASSPSRPSRHRMEGASEHHRPPPARRFPARHSLASCVLRIRPARPSRRPSARCAWRRFRRCPSARRLPFVSCRATRDGDADRHRSDTGGCRSGRIDGPSGNIARGAHPDEPVRTRQRRRERSRLPRGRPSSPSQMQTNPRRVPPSSPESSSRRQRPARLRHHMPSSARSSRMPPRRRPLPASSKRPWASSPSRRALPCRPAPCCCSRLKLAAHSRYVPHRPADRFRERMAGASIRHRRDQSDRTDPCRSPYRRSLGAWRRDPGRDPAVSCRDAAQQRTVDLAGPGDRARAGSRRPRRPQAAPWRGCRRAAPHRRRSRNRPLAGVPAPGA